MTTIQPNYFITLHSCNLFSYTTIQPSKPYNHPNYPTIQSSHPTIQPFNHQSGQTHTIQPSKLPAIQPWQPTNHPNSRKFYHPIIQLSCFPNIREQKKIHQTIQTIQLSNRLTIKLFNYPTIQPAKHPNIL